MVALSRVKRVFVTMGLSVSMLTGCQALEPLGQLVKPTLTVNGETYLFRRSQWPADPENLTLLSGKNLVFFYEAFAPRPGTAEGLVKASIVYEEAPDEFTRRSRLTDLAPIVAEKLAGVKESRNLYTHFEIRLGEYDFAAKAFSTRFKDSWLTLYPVDDILILGNDYAAMLVNGGRFARLPLAEDQAKRVVQAIGKERAVVARVFATVAGTTEGQFYTGVHKGRHPKAIVKAIREKQKKGPSESEIAGNIHGAGGSLYLNDCEECMLEDIRRYRQLKVLKLRATRMEFYLSDGTLIGAIGQRAASTDTGAATAAEDRTGRVEGPRHPA